MKIAIIGTRGIPNNYGGFEQFAEQLSVRLAERGHIVTVFNPSFHLYLEKTFKNVSIVKLPCHENILGGAAHFFYDYYCYKYAIKQNVDVALFCGYGTSAIAIALLNKHYTKAITNMDGFEWQRAKYNFITKKLLKWFEKIAVKYSDTIVADHSIIQKYYNNKYKVVPALISYGAEIPLHFDESTIVSFELTKYNYFLVVARDEPENQIEFIISAWKNSGNINKLCVVTNFQRLSRKYSNEKNIVFINRLYNSIQLSNLRHFSLACIHGHTVGGTNPSLLEAMAAQSFIIAHDNLFHREILENNAIYFNSESSLSLILHNFSAKSEKTDKAISNNLNKIRDDYQWGIITDKYLEVFEKILTLKKQKKNINADFR